MSADAWLAFDTSTDVLSVGLSAHGRTDLRTLAGGAQSSATLIPTVMDMLAQADIGLPRLQAIVFGRGRRLGEPLEGALITRTVLQERLAMIGQDCECDLDRAWLKGPVLPGRWEIGRAHV